MTINFNELTPGETERLAILSEECGEVIQAIGKILRHGYESTHPRGEPTNREALETEIAHVKFISRLMKQKYDLSCSNIIYGMVNKRKSIQQYLHHQ